MLKANNITLQPGGMGQQPQFAVYRGEPMQSRTASLRDAPEMQTTMLQSQGRTPFIMRREAPLPGSAQVDPTILAAQETAKAQASKNVDLKMAPQIAAATKKAERALELKSEAPAALSGVKGVISDLDTYIDTIDQLLRSPDRSSIVGRIEGNLHRLGSLGQNERQADLQAMFDRIKNTDTLASLISMKQASPTGGSPVGPASNLDVQLISKGANALIQTGSVAKFDEELKNVRRRAYRARANAIEAYNNRFGELAASDPRFKLTPRATADRYISTKDLPQNKSSAGGRKTSVIPDAAKQMLRKNPSPQQRAFFDRTFGAGAAAKVLGAR